MSVELPILYTSSKGEPVRTGSYSARSDFSYCPTYFDLKRRQGWRERESRISLQFGNVIEAGIRAFHEDGMRKGVAVAMFNTLWERLKSTKEFADYTYSAKEGNFDELWRMGREMMALYEVIAPSLPITLPRFQVKAKKEIFPNTELAGLWNTAYLDIVTYAPWDHPLLPAVDVLKEVGTPSPIAMRPLIIDIKTSGVELREDLVGLDPQLREYAWQRRIPDVAFLWFHKMGLTISKGDRVSSLEDGKKYIVAGVDKDANGEPVTVRVFPSAEAWEKFKAEVAVLVAEKERAIHILDDEESVLDEVLKGTRGKLRESLKSEQAAKRAELAERVNAADVEIGARHDAALTAAGMLVLPASQVTKQRIQFAAARLTQKDMDDAGRNVGQVTVQMAHSERTDYYPKTGGIRFPNNRCLTCCMRGICANKPELVDELLVKAGEEWLEGESG